MTTQVNLDDLYATYTEESQVKEANQFKTVPTALYGFTTESYEVRLGDDPEYPAEFERQHAHLTLNLFTVDKDSGEQVKRGKFFVNVSWQVRRITDGQKAGEMDRASKLWGNIVKALDANEKSVGDTLDLLKQSDSLAIFITEYLVRGEGADREFGRFKTPEERAALIEQGYTPKNAAQNISKRK